MLRSPLTLALAACLVAGSATAGAASARRAITQPAPPVTASAFPLEPAGAAPADGDGLIPNPATPTGSAIAPPPSCTVTFASASGATSATVNSWIAANENNITTTTVLCLNGTFTGPIHVWGKSSAALLEIAPAPGATATLALGQVQAADTNPNQFFGDSGGVSIVDLGGIWSNVQIWHNTISGMGATDRYNPLFEVDKQPNGGTNVVDCNDYGNLSTAGNTVNGNFALPSSNWLTLADWQAHNGHGWDADSAVGGFAANCPSGSIP